MENSTIYNKRTIESILDQKTGKEVLANDFFKKPIDEIFKLRYEFETAIRENSPRYVCYFCRQPIKIRGQNESKKILHFAHLKDSNDCSIKTNSKYTKEEILILKFNGAKESDLHIELKTFIAVSLENNKINGNGVTFVATEAINRHLAIPKKWKKPDVTSKYLDKSVVFELQLSTTFLSVINSRQEFYRENQTYIIWVFNDFETSDDRRKFTQSDVFYNNNMNGFELNNQAKEKSIQEGDLILKCIYQKPFIELDKITYKWASKYVKLSDLTFQKDNYKVYFYDVEGEIEKLKIELNSQKSILINQVLNGEEFKILNLFSKNYIVTKLEKEYILELYDKHVKPIEGFDTYSFEFRIVLTIICIKIGSFSFLKELIENYKLRKTLIDILSLKLNKIIGYGFKKQIEISHKLIDSRPEYLGIYLKAINIYRPLLLFEQDKTKKFQNKIDKLKELSKGQIPNFEIIKTLFPELI